jgi:voltage-gated sodium channel
MEEFMAHRRNHVTEDVPPEPPKEQESEAKPERTKSTTSCQRQILHTNTNEMSDGSSELNSNGSLVLTHLDRTHELAALNINFLEIGRWIDTKHRVKIPSIKEAGIVAFLKAVAHNLLNNIAFEPSMGMVIVANSICVGVAINQDLKGMDAKEANNIEHLFLVIFIIELLLRLFVRGWKGLRNAWTLFDFVIVLIGVLSQWVLDPIAQSERFKNNALVLQGAQPVLVLRMLKLLRLVRAVRLVATFKPLWKLTQGFLSSAGTMVSAVVMLVLTLYIFACVGAEVIAKVSWETQFVSEFVLERFSTLPLIMLTLVQFITLDSISGFYFPMILEKPALSIYFLALVVFVGVALMNLITAMLVEAAVVSASEDKEMQAFYNRQKEKKLKPSLEQFFALLDKSGDNVVTAKEIVEDLQAEIEIPSNLRGVVTEARIVELFDHLDHDGNGELTQEEFVNGMLMVAFSEVPVESKQMLHLLIKTRSQMGRLEKYLHHISHGVDQMRGARHPRGHSTRAPSRFAQTNESKLDCV